VTLADLVEHKADLGEFLKRKLSGFDASDFSASMSLPLLKM
jgi:hypothetical protein